MVNYGTVESQSLPSDKRKVVNARRSVFLGVVGIAAVCLLGAAYIFHPRSTALKQKMSFYGTDAMMDPRGTNAAFIGKGDGDGTSSKMSAKQMFGTNAAFMQKGDGAGLRRVRLTPSQMMGTNSVFINKGDGSEQSTKGRIQSLWDVPKYEWSADMEGTYLPARPELTGEETKQINLIGQPFVHPLTDETNLGGIPGDGPANVLPGYKARNLVSLKGMRAKLQSLWDVPKYVWTADMEGTYLPARPELTGEDTKMINLIGPPFAHPLTDETNLGGIPGDGPANVLPGY